MTTGSRSAAISACVAALVALAAGCAARSTVPSVSAVASPTHELASTVAGVFASARDAALWTAHLVWSDSGDLVFSHNADQPVLPASNMKVVTLAAAAQRLGWDHRFETTLFTTEPATDGVVPGDLFVRGSGDPTLGWPTGEATRVLQAWARDLRAQGVRRIEGDLVGDADTFGTDRLGHSWTVDDLAFGYGAPYAGLTFHENVVRVMVTPAGQAGESATVILEPTGSGLRLDPRVTTAPGGESPSLGIDRDPGSDVLRVRGAVPQDAGVVTRFAAVPDPPRFFLQTLRVALAREGIEVRGVARTGDAPPPDSAMGAHVVHRSPPLRDVAVRFMKVSQNLYGEALLHALVAGRDTSLAERREAVGEALTALGVAADRVMVSDGSGLSRRNFLTTRTLVALLRALATPPHAEPFRATLPIAGVDGTLERRLAGTACEGRLVGKTGTLLHARALSGYITTASGRPVTFAIIANNYLVPTGEIDAIVDRALVAVCTF
jgi:serine-type D-Ala-D-Ala carboxypeptidase/endopeptidase (penicillin-binding protein 4)